MPFCISSAMLVDAVELQKVLLKCQVPTRSSAAGKMLVSFRVIWVTLAIVLLFSVTFCAMLVLLAVVLLGLTVSLPMLCQGGFGYNLDSEDFSLVLYSVWQQRVLTSIT